MWIFLWSNGGVWSKTRTPYVLDIYPPLNRARVLGHFSSGLVYWKIKSYLIEGCSGRSAMVSRWMCDEIHEFLILRASLLLIKAVFLIKLSKLVICWLVPLPLGIQTSCVLHFFITTLNILYQFLFQCLMPRTFRSGIGPKTIFIRLSPATLKL